MKPKTIVRIVVGVLLAVALALGLMDFLAKTNARKTAEAWQAQVEKGVPEFALDQHIVGSPEVASKKPSERIEYLTYTWAGIIRDYRVEVTCLGAKSTEGKRFVSKVEGPLSD